MRIPVFVLLAVVLGACATTPTVASNSSPTMPAAPVAQAPPATSRIGHLLAAAGRPNAPTRAEIERAMGPADIARQDGAGVALTYRLDHCALLLVFGADARNEMRLADVHPSARNAGDAAPSIDQCAAEATARYS